MALTDEQILQQINVLTTKTSENTQMTYRTNGTLNKALNPDIFSGNNTKIVNAINLVASMADTAAATSNAVSEKLNSILLDIDSVDNIAIWENVKGLMGKDTIIEGLESILQGQKQEQILGISAKDIGKVLSIDVNEKGEAIIKAIDQIGSGSSGSAKVEDIAYENSQVSTITNVKDALDYLVDQVKNSDFGGELGGETIVGEITWDMIDDRPQIIADGLEMTNDALQLKDGDSVVSSVMLVTNEDIETIIEELE